MAVVADPDLAVKGMPLTPGGIEVKLSQWQSQRTLDAEKDRGDERL